jgi:hypothetical protein
MLKFWYQKRYSVPNYEVYVTLSREPLLGWTLTAFAWRGKARAFELRQELGYGAWHTFPVIIIGVPDNGKGNVIPDSYFSPQSLYTLYQQRLFLTTNQLRTFL